MFILCAFLLASLHAFCTLKLLPQTVPKRSPVWLCHQTLNNPPYGFSRNPHFLLSFRSPKSREFSFSVSRKCSGILDNSGYLIILEFIRYSLQTRTTKMLLSRLLGQPFTWSQPCFPWVSDTRYSNVKISFNNVNYVLLQCTETVAIGVTEDLISCFTVHLDKKWIQSKL